MSYGSLRSPRAASARGPRIGLDVRVSGFPLIPHSPANPNLEGRFPAMSIDTSPTAPATDRDAQLNEIITATAAAVADDVDNALAVFRAEGEGVRQVATDIRIGDHRITVDEPPALGGENTDPNPVEAVLAGLLSCQVVTYRFWAAKLGIPLDRVHVETEGDLDVRGFFGLDDAVRPGFGEVRLKVTLDGPAGPERYRELQEVVDRHCPVLDLISNPTRVVTQLV
jgi:uncharacterized OsmC-like protein